MKVIQATVEIGEDRVLHVPLPADTETGSFEVLVVLEPRRRQVSREERRAGAEAGRGALRGIGLSTDDFLAERRADEARRDRALGLFDE